MNPCIGRNKQIVGVWGVRLVVLAVILALFVSACEDSDPSAPEPVSAAVLKVLAGADQLWVAGSALPEEIQLRALGDGGEALSGVAISVSVSTGGGSVSTSEITTSSDGTATLSWTLGSSAGEQMVLASAGAASVQVRAEAVPGASYDVDPVTGVEAELAGGGRVTVPADAVQSLSQVAVSESLTDEGDRRISLLPAGVELEGEPIRLTIALEPDADPRDAAIYRELPSGRLLLKHGWLVDNNASPVAVGANETTEEAIAVETVSTGNFVSNYFRRMSPGDYTYAIDHAWSIDQRSAIRAGVRRWFPYFADLGISFEEISDPQEADIPLYLVDASHEVFSGVSSWRYPDPDDVNGFARLSGSREIFILDRVEGGDDVVAEIYSGHVPSGVVQGSLERLAAHEFGHAIGIDHPSHRACRERNGVTFDEICIAPPLMARYDGPWGIHPYNLTATDLAALLDTYTGLFSGPSLSIGAPSQLVADSQTLPPSDRLLAPGASVPTEVEVHVHDDEGRPIWNATVVPSLVPPGGFSEVVTAGRSPGALGAPVLRSNPDGVVRVGAWQVGEDPGVHALRLMLPVPDEEFFGGNPAAGVDPSRVDLSHPAIVVVQVEVAVPEQIQAPQHVQAALGDSAPLKIRIVAGDGRGIDGATVDFHVGDEHGSLSSSREVTQGGGFAEVHWTAPQEPGEYEIEVAMSDQEAGVEVPPLTVPARAVDARTLTVTQSGQGSVTSSPGGIQLTQEGSTAAQFAEGATVTLTATPGEGWQVESWGGACSGSGGTCEVSMTGDRSVAVSFEEGIPPSITTSSLPGGTVGQSYSASLNASGGQTPYTWSLASGSAPVGLNLSAGGTLSGTPTSVGSYTFAVRVTGADGLWSTREFTVVVESTAGNLFFLDSNGVTIRCPDAVVGDTGIVNGTTYTKRTSDQITTENATTTCTSGITDMGWMFFGASTFNQDIGHWDVGNVESMLNTFNKASSFNQDISNWDVGNVKSMHFTFAEASAFNQDIGNWDVGNVTSMYGMFGKASSFNQDIGGWDVGRVTNMNWMFFEARTFNQDLSPWCVTEISSTPDSFDSGATSWTLPRPIWGTCPSP